MFHLLLEYQMADDVHKVTGPRFLLLHKHLWKNLEPPKARVIRSMRMLVVPRVRRG